MSLFIPLLVAAQFMRRWVPTGFGKWFSPMWLWFLVPNVIILQPWDWDNTKFFIFWALLGSVMVGGLLAGMFKRGPAGVAIASFCLLALDLWAQRLRAEGHRRETDPRGRSVRAGPGARVRHRLSTHRSPGASGSAKRGRRVLGRARLARLHQRGVLGLQGEGLGRGNA